MGKRKFNSLPQTFISDGQLIKSISEKQMIYKKDQWKCIKKQSEREKIDRIILPEGTKYGISISK
jgi:hypothetical protein